MQCHTCLSCCLQQEAAGGHEVDARPGLVRVSDPETEHRAHGHRHGLMHNIEDKRAAQVHVAPLLLLHAIAVTALAELHTCINGCCISVAASQY